MAITLSNANTTLTASYSGDSAVETINNHTDYAAVFGPAGHDFTVTNQATITDPSANRYAGGILLAALGTVINKGTITTSGGDGIQLQSGGYALNTGTITSQGIGIYAATGTIRNTALIATSTVDGAGIILLDGGAAFNTGTITGGQGILFRDNLDAPDYTNNRGTIAVKTLAEYFGQTGLAINTGTITSSQDAIDLKAGGTVLNNGDLFASRFAISTGSYLSLTNSGAIAGIITAATGADIENDGNIFGTIAAGTASIANAGTIAGVITTTGATDIDNSGLISSPFPYDPHASAVYLGSGHLINSGTMTETVDFTTGLGTAVNSGLIEAGILLALGGTVINTGLMQTAANFTTDIGAAGPAFISNKSTVIAYGGYAVWLHGGGTVTNSGSIQAAKDGLDFDAPGLATNRGQISAGGDGIYLLSGGTVRNTGIISGAVGIDAAFHAPATIDNAGLISALTIAIELAGGGTLTNSGTITGAVSFATGNANRLIITHTSTISGAINGGAGTLEFASSATTGTFTAAETTQFNNFAALQIDHGAVWDFSGSQTLASATLQNSGTIKQSAHTTLTIEDAITGTGTIKLATGALALENTVAGQIIDFTGTGETLALTDPHQFDAKIEHFALGDTIDLTSITLSAITATHFVHSVLTFTEAGTRLFFTFANPATFAHETFKLTQSAHGTDITLAAAASHLPITLPTTLTPLPTFTP